MHGGGLWSRVRIYLGFTRPFTLLPPMVGVISGALTAFGSAHNPDPQGRFTVAVVAMIVLGSALFLVRQAVRRPRMGGASPAGNSPQPRNPQSGS